MADDETDMDDDGSEERRRARREKWKKAIKESFLDAIPRARQQSARSGAEIDSEIAALDARVSALEASDAAQNARLTALEAGEPVDPPVEPPIEPIDPPVEPPAGKRYPTADDPACGVPAGTSLANSGGTTISQSGAKISGKKYTGQVTVTADDVEMFNCEVNTGSYFAIDWKGKRGKLHHCNVINTTNSGSSGVNMRDLNAHHNRMRGHENCFNVAGNGGVIEWNDCDKMGGVQGQAHYDCIQADGGIDGLTIKNNRLNCDKGDTSGCMLDNYWGPIRNVTVENNFIGGGSFPAYLDGKFNGSGAATNIVYKNNDMRAGGWGGYFYWQSAGSGCQRTGNKDWKTGASVDNA